VCTTEELDIEFMANQLGYEAGCKHVYPSCPYKAFTPKAEAWWDGYEDGLHDTYFVDTYSRK
jgi:ribosome modulation factor